MAKIVLASGSPRRQELLHRMGIDEFDIRVPNVEETYPDGLTPPEIVSYISREKAEAARKLCSADEILITADTMLMGQAKKDPSKLQEAEAVKAQVAAQAQRLTELEAEEASLEEDVRKRMLQIPQMLDPTVPIGKDDSENVEVQRFGEPLVPDFEIPYHTDIMETFGGIDLDAARRVAGNGFYYLLGDIARLHEAVLAYARDFMIDKGFTYVIPPFMRVWVNPDSLNNYGLAMAFRRI